MIKQELDDKAGIRYFMECRTIFWIGESFGVRALDKGMQDDGMLEGKKG